MNPKYFAHIPEVQDVVYRMAARNGREYIKRDGTKVYERAPEMPPLEPGKKDKEQYWGALWAEASLRLDHVVLRAIRDEYIGWPGYSHFWIIVDISHSAGWIADMNPRPSAYYKVSVERKSLCTSPMDLAWWERIASKEVDAGFRLVRDEFIGMFRSQDIPDLEKRMESHFLDCNYGTWSQGAVIFPTYPWVTAQPPDFRNRLFRERGYRYRSNRTHWPPPDSELFMRYYRQEGYEFTPGEPERWEVKDESGD